MSILPALARILGGLGDRLKAARLRRRYSADMVAQRAGIARATLSRIEQGDPGVSFGNYARVMQVLRLEQDLNRLAADDELGRKLQDAEIGTRARAPRRNQHRVKNRPVKKNERPAEIGAGLCRCRGDGWSRADGHICTRRAPAGRKCFPSSTPRNGWRVRRPSLLIPICSCWRGRSIRHSLAVTLAFFSTQLLIDGDVC